MKVDDILCLATLLLLILSIIESFNHGLDIKEPVLKKINNPDSKIKKKNINTIISKIKSTFHMIIPKNFDSKTIIDKSHPLYHITIHKIKSILYDIEKGGKQNYSLNSVSPITKYSFNNANLIETKFSISNKNEKIELYLVLLILDDKNIFIHKFKVLSKTELNNNIFTNSLKFALFENDFNKYNKELLKSINYNKWI